MITPIEGIYHFHLLMRLRCHQYPVFINETFQELLCRMVDTVEIPVKVVQDMSCKLLDILHISMLRYLVVPIKEGFLEPAKLLWQMPASFSAETQTGISVTRCP